MIDLNQIHIEWGEVGRTDSLEKFIMQKSKKILRHSKEATNLLITLSVENPKNSAGKPIQKVEAELRFPKHQDIFVAKQGQDIHKTLLEVQHAILSQINSRKSHRLAKRHEEPKLQTVAK